MCLGGGRGVGVTGFGLTPKFYQSFFWVASFTLLTLLTVLRLLKLLKQLTTLTLLTLLT